ncbi:hypothetical protein P153DRAFT_401708 [Dothidotthia symphoricarpi CBS 119687]|uniref:Uncharacterized protein n=1 Tax=Dothidotthia symphoricarpi CBS 119687 TaxID=1392245 RepID=A0A6A5ZZQ6_9PLEO|nr:uncharacterized protein P153DRAFT_401708 [Dothidotthia symphoricarpi CBS 119687]KAF2123811.1 hypothetical protein P153DRAFT_401708 [Dothidotthia symphoricarpi CBS 119687]
MLSHVVTASYQEKSTSPHLQQKAPSPHRSRMSRFHLIVMPKPVRNPTALQPDVAALIDLTFTNSSTSQTLPADPTLKNPDRSPPPAVHSGRTQLTNSTASRIEQLLSHSPSLNSSAARPRNAQHLAARTSHPPTLQIIEFYPRTATIGAQYFVVCRTADQDHPERFVQFLPAGTVRIDLIAIWLAEQKAAERRARDAAENRVKRAPYCAVCREKVDVVEDNVVVACCGMYRCLGAARTSRVDVKQIRRSAPHALASIGKTLRVDSKHNRVHGAAELGGNHGRVWGVWAKLGKQCGHHGR